MYIPYPLQEIYTHNVVIKNSNEIVKNVKLLPTKDKQKLDKMQVSDNVEACKKTIVLPGLINLHAHLGYGEFKISSQNLFAWLKALLKNFNHRMDTDGFTLKTKRSANTFVRNAVFGGTTFIIDNSTIPDISIDAYLENQVKGLVGFELFCSNFNFAEQYWQEKLPEIENLEQKIQSTGAKLELCLSPHASYDVAPALWQKALAWTIEKNQQGANKLLLSHVAESEAEEEWFRDKDSPKAQSAKDFWQSIATLEPKLNQWKPHESSIDFLLKNQMLEYNSLSPILLTHLCYAREQDLQALVNLGIKACTCPRSNEYLKNKLPDIEKWIELNLNFGFGTDSMASNEDTDMRKEASMYPALNARQKLDKLTIDAAKVLNREHEIGSLEAGKALDYCVLEVLDDSIDIDAVCPIELALDIKKTKVIETVIDGRIVYRADEQNIAKMES